MKAREAVIAWTPANLPDNPLSGRLKIGIYQEGWRDGWARGFLMTGGAATSERRSLSDSQAALAVLWDFHTMTVRDGIDVLVAHEAFLAIDEYAAQVSVDIPRVRDPETLSD